MTRRHRTTPRRVKPPTPRPYRRTVFIWWRADDWGVI